MYILLAKETAKNGARESGFELKMQNMEIPSVEAMVCSPFLTLSHKDKFCVP